MMKTQLHVLWAGVKLPVSSIGKTTSFFATHLTFLKFKAWVIETWLAQGLRAEPFHHAIGYNSDEESRIAKSEAAFASRNREDVRVAFGFNCDEEGRMAKARQYDSPQRIGWYPLSKAEWSWTRQNCLDYLKRITGISWQKSACVGCPFCARTEDALERMRNFPD